MVISLPPSLRSRTKLHSRPRITSPIWGMTLQMYRIDRRASDVGRLQSRTFGKVPHNTSRVTILRSLAEGKAGYAVARFIPAPAGNTLCNTLMYPAIHDRQKPTDIVASNPGAPASILWEE